MAQKNDQTINMSLGSILHLFNEKDATAYKLARCLGVDMTMSNEDKPELNGTGGYEGTRRR